MAKAINLQRVIINIVSEKEKEKNKEEKSKTKKIPKKDKTKMINK